MKWTISNMQNEIMLASSVSAFPLEACGLFLGSTDENSKPTGKIEKVWPTRNTEESARLYTIDTVDMFEANKYAIENDLEIVGVYHSHTHSEAYPSPTDVKQAVDPSWAYAIISLMQDEPSTRFFQINQNNIEEVKFEID